MTNKFFGLVISLVCLAWSNQGLASKRGHLPLTWDALLKMSREMSLPHEGQPEGVPLDYDWLRNPRLGAGNNPGDFTAITGWGQVFSAKGSSASSISIKIRDMRVLACYGRQRRWVLLQQGVIEGSQFRPDFQGNVNKPPLHYSHAAGATSVRFEKNFTYHFWPNQGRADLPAKDICGIVVLLQAKMIPPGQDKNSLAKRSGVLLGLGADYWRDKGAGWDNYQSNRDVAIGRLKWVSTSWHWFGLITASMEDLRRLYALGYELKAPHPQ